MTAMENGGRFTDGQVDHLRSLEGWSVTSGVVHLYVKKIIEQYSDSAGLITPGRYIVWSCTCEYEKDTDYDKCILHVENHRSFTDNTLSFA